jgi:hypothetical protein
VGVLPGGGVGGDAAGAAAGGGFGRLEVGGDGPEAAVGCVHRQGLRRRWPVGAGRQGRWGRPERRSRGEMECLSRGRDDGVSKQNYE